MSKDKPPSKGKARKRLKVANDELLKLRTSYNTYKKVGYKAEAPFMVTIDTKIQELEAERKDLEPIARGYNKYNKY